MTPGVCEQGRLCLSISKGKYIFVVRTRHSAECDNVPNFIFSYELKLHNYFPLDILL